MIPYLAIGAFAGLRAAEIERLDWADIKENFIEVTSRKAKTRSRRLVPLLPNLAKWLEPYRKTTGAVVTFANVSKQLLWLAEETANDGDPAVRWRHNGLRHSFISYRIADVQNVNQVALEAGNSPQMIFQHYRELVTPPEAKEWFGIPSVSRKNGTAAPTISDGAKSYVRGQLPNGVSVQSGSLDEFPAVI